MELNKFNIILNDDIYLSFNSRKDSVIRYINKHFIENEDFIKYKNRIRSNGGFNRIDYKMTEKSFELLKNSYKLRQIELGNKSLTHPILIYAETAIVGFIFKVFKEYNMIKQYKVGKYFIDLFFINYNLAIEIDEQHHETIINKQLDIEREKYLKKELNCIVYRYKPHEDKLHDMMHYIMNIVSQPKIKC